MDAEGETLELMLLCFSISRRCQAEYLHDCLDDFEFSYMIGLRISRLMLAEIIIFVLDIISDQ